MFIDSHCHFDMCLEDKTLTEEILISALKENEVKYAVQVSTEPEIFEWSYEFSKRNENIFFSIGIHPSTKAIEYDLNYFSGFIIKIFENNDRKKLFGVGEAGLDYYRMRQPKEMQIRSFEYQIDIAKEYNLPIIVHSRDAMDDTLAILKAKHSEMGLMHCFSGNSESAKKFLDLGFYISFAGNLTYNKAHDLHDSASYVPLDRLLLETDAPYLSPVPLRGKKNRSENVVHTYKFLSGLRKEKLSIIADNIYNNFSILASK